VRGTSSLAAAGTDYDQVAVTGRIGVAGSGTVLASEGISNLDLNLTLPIPSKLCKADDDGTIVLVSASAMGDPTTAETLHAVSLAPIATSEGDKYYWGVKDGMTLADVVSYVDNSGDGVTDRLVLNGAALEWKAMMADANLDDEVGIADLSAVADNYGETVGMSWLTGDFNLDGEVGIADLSAVADNYGNVGSPPSPPGGGTVPEPATLALLALGGAALIRRRRSAH